MEIQRKTKNKNLYLSFAPFDKLGGNIVALLDKDEFRRKTVEATVDKVCELLKRLEK